MKRAKFIQRVNCSKWSKNVSVFNIHESKEIFYFISKNCYTTYVIGEGPHSGSKNVPNVNKCSTAVYTNGVFKIKKQTGNARWELRFPRAAC